MKKIVLLIITLFLTAQTIKSQTVVLDANGVTVKWTGTTVPTPYFVQANPRGTGMEWFAIVNNTTKPYINSYSKNFQSGITYFKPPSSTTSIPFNNIVTTLVTDMSSMFSGAAAFNQSISSWDVSNVTNMSNMFSGAAAFNQPIGSWNVSNVTYMGNMFSNTAFNQNIGSWNVSSVTSMYAMFSSTPFNQPIDTWNVSNVTDMGFLFYNTSFNQNIGSWDVSNVTNMSFMFRGAASFNQNIGSWNVSSVTNMKEMFFRANTFNQPIGSWNVSNVTDMGYMFSEAYAFNQNIGSWDVGNVTNMGTMFSGAVSFNQNIGSWNVKKVSSMLFMFSNGAGLSTANYDALLIAWSTRPGTTIPGGANGSTYIPPLKPNVSFWVGNSKYCNGATARASIISTYGWTITDAGLDCTSLDTETFEKNSLKLYPNPVLNVLNVNVDSNLINQPYNVVDGL